MPAKICGTRAWWPRTAPISAAPRPCPFQYPTPMRSVPRAPPGVDSSRLNSRVLPSGGSSSSTGSIVLGNGRSNPDQSPPKHHRPIPLTSAHSAPWSASRDPTHPMMALLSGKIPKNPGAPDQLPGRARGNRFHAGGITGERNRTPRGTSREKRELFTRMEQPFTRNERFLGQTRRRSFARRTRTGLLRRTAQEASHGFYRISWRANRNDHTRQPPPLRTMESDRSRWATPFGPQLRHEAGGWSVITLRWPRIPGLANVLAVLLVCASASSVRAANPRDDGPSLDCPSEEMPKSSAQIPSIGTMGGHRQRGIVF